jgi:hypothetical protein
MSSRLAWRVSAAVLALVALGAQAAPAIPGGTPEGRWRVSRGIAAPWLEAGSSVDQSAWLGATIEFSPSRFSAPQGLGCDNPRYEIDQREPAGLFLGALGEPGVAGARAAALALTSSTVPSVTLRCDSGLFDLHWATPQAVMLALDNVIWVLDRSPGALAADDTPEAMVQHWLELHFAGDMGFTSAALAGKLDRLSVGLRAEIERYFATPFAADEPPPVDGDPFTDAQDYPVLFSVGAGSPSGDGSEVTVRYDDGHRSRQVVFLLQQQESQWRIDDLRYEDGSTLRALLAPSS